MVTMSKDSNWTCFQKWQGNIYAKWPMICGRWWFSCGFAAQVQYPMNQSWEQGTFQEPQYTSYDLSFKYTGTPRIYHDLCEASRFPLGLLFRDVFTWRPVQRSASQTRPQRVRKYFPKRTWTKSVYGFILWSNGYLLNSCLMLFEIITMQSVCNSLVLSSAHEGNRVEKFVPYTIPHNSVSPFCLARLKILFVLATCLKFTIPIYSVGNLLTFVKLPNQFTWHILVHLARK